MRVKIFGAGSIGNHLSNASRAIGWSVDLCDIDESALNRTKNEIYPGRYGKWDESIRLMNNKDAPKGEYDLIFIGTPPDSHIALAIEAVKEKPKAVLVEKPFCCPDLVGAQELFELAKNLDVAVFTGYDHVVGKASKKFGDLVATANLGAIETLDVEFREFWGGIFAAHPWLSGPADSYLGFWARGGGASGEHSHAANLWQHFAYAAGAGRIIEVTANMEFEREGKSDYDKLSSMTLLTENGLIGRVVQDVVTAPPRKWARLQGTKGYVEWHCAYSPGIDAVFQGTGEGQISESLFTKTRPDDFIQELRHIQDSLISDPWASPISITRGLDTMLVIAAAHKSVWEKHTIRIDYSKGYTPAALQLA